MSSTTFVNGVTLTDEDWFNDLDRLHYDIMGDPATAVAALDALNLARADIASATTLDLDAATSTYLRVTGTTTTTAVTLADGSRRSVVAAAAWPLTHGASLILPGAASHTCTAGDILHFHGESGGVVRVEIVPSALIPALVDQAVAEAGTDNNPREWSALRVAQAIAALAGAGGQYKVFNFTKDRSTATGTNAYTGIGFQPKAAIFFAAVNNTTGRMSVGMDDGTTKGCVLDYTPVSADQWDSATAVSIYSLSGATETYTGYVQSWDADGFTISWTKTGSPTGTMNVKAILFG